MKLAHQAAAAFFAKCAQIQFKTLVKETTSQIEHHAVFEPRDEHQVGKNEDALQGRPGDQREDDHDDAIERIAWHASRDRFQTRVKAGFVARASDGDL